MNFVKYRWKNIYFEELPWRLTDKSWKERRGIVMHSRRNIYFLIENRSCRRNEKVLEEMSQTCHDELLFLSRAGIPNFFSASSFSQRLSLDLSRNEVWWSHCLFVMSTSVQIESTCVIIYLPFLMVQSIQLIKNKS